MNRFMIELTSREIEALYEACHRDRRSFRDQAVLFIRQGLEDCGLLGAHRDQMIERG